MRRHAARMVLAVLLCAGGCSDDQRPAVESPAVTEQPLIRSEPPTVPANPLDSLLTVAESKYREGDYGTARAHWLHALQQIATLGDSLAEPRVLTWLGLAAWREGDYPEARRLGEQALALKLRTRHPELWKSYNALGLLAWNQGRLGDAITLFGDAMRSARQTGDAEGLAKGASNLGLVQAELGEFVAARHGFLAALRAGRELSDGQVEGGALANLGMLSVWAGDPAVAVGWLDQARRVYQKLDYPIGEENVLGQLGSSYAALGDFRRALLALDSARAVAERHGLRQEAANDLEMTADVYRVIGDNRQALASLARAERIARELGLQIETGNILRKQAAIHAALGAHDAARDRLEAALRTHRAAGAHFAELHDHLMLAEVASVAGRHDDATRALRRARALANTQDAPLGPPLVALTEARIADRVRDPRRVLAVLASPASRSTTPSVQWERDALRARAFARLELSDSAVAAGRRAVAALERLRGSLADPSLRSVFTTDKSTVYADLAVALLRMGRTDEAFAVADAARGRALLEHLSATRNGASARSSIAGFAEADLLLRRIDALVARLQELERSTPDERGEAAEPAEQLGQQLHAAREAYEALLVRSANQQPRAAGVLGVRPLVASEVRAALRPGELLLEYLVTPEAVLIFAASRSGVRTFEVSIASTTLEGRIRVARALLVRRNAGLGDAAPVLDSLAANLFAPVAREGLLREADRLIVVPHGALALIPFGALRSPETGLPLAEHHPVWTLPSAAALPVLRTEQERRAWALRAPRPAAFAPFPEALPASGREARTFRAVLPRSSARFGEQASEAQLRRALARGAMVHVASHGMMNPHNPMFSRIQVARGPRGSAANDGRLEVHEVLGLSVQSPLVFLSGCETGLGSAAASDFAPREDHTTLAQSFLFAGARNVVATLWRVDDAGAAAFAARFYRHLRRMPPPEALAAAQRDLRRDARYQSPFYWAGYVLTGEGNMK